MKKKLLILLLSFILPVIVFAEGKWVSAALQEDNGLLYEWTVNTKIAKEIRYGETFYKVWVKRSNVSGGSDEFLGLQEFDSSFTKYRYISFIVRENGKTTCTDNETGEWTYIVPDSNGEEITETIKSILNGAYK